MFVHTVYFSLKPETAKDPSGFIAELRKMAVIEGLRQFEIGSPAGTDRPVVDADYEISLHTAFDDSAAHDRYQAHPIHLAFIDVCKDKWRGVRVFDSVTVD